jgi:hypothetical protein
MNERIKELAEQAGWNGYDALDDRIEKFAELILNEALAVIDKDYKESLDDTGDDWDRGYLSGLSAARNIIVQHFQE